MFQILLSLGMTPNKSKTLRLPAVPVECFGDFVRGYFDGDGNILFKEYFRKNRNKFKFYFAVKFTSGSLLFLESLRERLITVAEVGKGSLFPGDRSFVLSYAMKDSKRICDFMYNGVSERLFLERKYCIFSEAKKIMGW